MDIRRNAFKAALAGGDLQIGLWSSLCSNIVAEILGDSGKIVIENSATATVTRLTMPERELSDGMDREDTAKLLSGRLN